MRAVAITKQDYSQNLELLDAIHQLRARIFAGRLGWNVCVVDGRERDEYDDLNPTYLAVLTDTGVLAGCARLLPARGPTMAVNTFSQLLATGLLGAHEEMVESSRFCVDTSLSRSGDASLLHEATTTLFAGIIEWSVANDYTKILTVTDVRFERILKRASWPLARLGDAHAIGNTIAVAGVLPADDVHFERLRPPSYCSDFRQVRRIAA